MTLTNDQLVVAVNERLEAGDTITPETVQLLVARLTSAGEMFDVFNRLLHDNIVQIQAAILQAQNTEDARQCVDWLWETAIECDDDEQSFAVALKAGQDALDYALIHSSSETRWCGADGCTRPASIKGFGYDYCADHYDRRYVLAVRALTCRWGIEIRGPNLPQVTG